MESNLPSLSSGKVLWMLQKLVLSISKFIFTLPPLQQNIKQAHHLKAIGILDSFNCFSPQCENSPLPAKHTYYHWYFLFAYLCITVPCFRGDISYLVLLVFVLLLLLCV